MFVFLFYRFHLFGKGGCTSGRPEGNVGRGLISVHLMSDFSSLVASAYINLLKVPTTTVLSITSTSTSVISISLSEL